MLDTPPIGINHRDLKSLRPMSARPCASRAVCRARTPATESGFARADIAGRPAGQGIHTFLVGCAIEPRRSGSRSGQDLSETTVMTRVRTVFRCCKNATCLADCGKFHRAPLSLRFNFGNMGAASRKSRHLCVYVRGRSCGEAGFQPAGVRRRANAEFAFKASDNKE